MRAGFVVTNFLLLLILITLLFGKDVTIAALIWIWDVNETIGRFTLGLAIAIAVFSGPVLIVLAYAMGSSINSMLGYTASLLFGFAYLRFGVAAVKSFSKKSWESLTASQRISILKTRAETRRRKRKDGQLWANNG